MLRKTAYFMLFLTLYKNGLGSVWTIQNNEYSLNSHILLVKYC